MALLKGRFGWRTLAGLGVATVISGQFAGWNYGLHAGWPNMVAATALMFAFYLGFIACISELAAAIPDAGGLGAYCQRALGPTAGFFVGFVAFASLTCGVGTVSTFVAGYAESVLGFPAWVSKTLLFGVVTVLHMFGIESALRLTFVAGAAAVTTIVLFVTMLLPGIDVGDLVPSDWGGALTFTGVFSAIPYAIYLFLCLEQMASASEEVRDPGTSMPRGLYAALFVLGVTGAGVVVIAPAAGGVAAIASSTDPLIAAVSGASAGKSGGWLASAVGTGALVGLVASFVSMMFAASRLLFALSRLGYFSPSLGRINKAGAPAASVLTVSVAAAAVSGFDPEDVLVAVAMLLGGSYLLTVVAFIVLRIREPRLSRPYRAPGGVALALVVAILTATMIAACFQMSPAVVACVGALLVVAIVVLATRRETG